MVVSDNGTELTSNAILKWQEDRKVELHYIAPASPCRTGWSSHSMADRETNSIVSFGFAEGVYG